MLRIPFELVAYVSRSKRWDWMEEMVLWSLLGTDFAYILFDAAAGVAWIE